MDIDAAQPNETIVDLQQYADKILDDEDRPLFDEAVKAANVGALRAAYIMVWLACAESLKRRFKEAAVRDSAAGTLVDQINRREQNQSSVDKILISHAKTYGFISDSGHTDLVNVYDNRCIYGHPYHEAPSVEKLLSAADAVVGLVLSQPILLKQGFGTQLLNDLMTNRPYLDDQASVVEEFARNMAPRFHEDVLVWFLDQCLERIDTMSGDASMGLFSRRGVWFTRAFLQGVGVAILTADEWHVRSIRYPSAFTMVCSAPTIFEQLGGYAQDALVGLVIDQSTQQISVLRSLGVLSEANVLSDRQAERYLERVEGLDIGDFGLSGLGINFAYKKIVGGLESLTWPLQNPAASLISSYGPDEIARLTGEQQITLGRNVLQADDGSSRGARACLAAIAGQEECWPVDFLRGVFLECFTNEDHGIRLKTSRLDLVLRGVSKLDFESRNELIGETVDSIRAGEPTRLSNREEFEAAVNLLNDEEWSGAVADALQRKEHELVRQY